MKKKLILFTPLVVSLILTNIAAIVMSFILNKWQSYLVTLLLLVCSAFVWVKISSVSKSINKFYQSMTKQLSPYENEAMLQFPVPIVVTKQCGEIIWYNKQMQEQVFCGEDCYGSAIGEFFPTINLNLPCPQQGYGVEYSNKQYTAYSSKTGDEESNLNVVYFFDDDKLKRIAREYFSSRTVVALILIDNYEELLQNARENERSQIMPEIEYQIESFVGGYNGLIKKLEKDRFFVVFEERYMRAIVDNRFTILDVVRRINANDKMPATLSIGVGRDAQNMAQAEKFAGQALDMALGRGGDQAAVKNKNGYEFYGGVSKGIEKRTKVKTRIVAAALTELIESSSNVLVMGHRFADLDCLGSAVGLYHPIRDMGKPAKIVLNSSNNLVKPLYNKLIANKFDDAFVEPSVATDFINEGTLLIITDVHTPHLLEAPEVYKQCKNVVVIDHHRKMVDYIDNAVIFHHEPYASSASEMVSELIQYFGDKYKPNRVVAEALLAGIMLDTKNFVMRTGIRTFEAAAFLRRMGADTVDVKRLFSSSMEAYQKRCQVVANAEVYRNCAISAVDEPVSEIKLVAPQAADELLGIEEVDASFVLYYESATVVSFSARSMGKINVQLIMEKLGGGGHLTMAGAQMKDMTLESARKMLIEAIDHFYETREEIKQ